MNVRILACSWAEEQSWCTECLSRLLSFTLQHSINWRLPKAPSRSSAQQRIKNYLTWLSAFHMLTSALLSFSACVCVFFFFGKPPHHSSRSLMNSRRRSGSARCPMGAQSATSAITTGTCTRTWPASTRRMWKRRSTVWRPGEEEADSLRGLKTNTAGRKKKKERAF